MFHKLRDALTLFDDTEIFILLLFVIVYHVVILLLITMWVRASASLRLRSLETERDEYKKHWENRDAAWNDREDALRRTLAGEREREVFQLRAEYDSYIGLLENKLERTKIRETGST